MPEAHHDRRRVTNLARDIAAQELALFSRHVGHIRTEAGA
jgi:hypothetical protein